MEPTPRGLAFVTLRRAAHLRSWATIAEFVKESCRAVITDWYCRADAPLPVRWSEFAMASFRPNRDA
jgi:hypothetical protein